MPRMVFLHGSLKEKFGGPFELHCASTADAVKLMVANFSEFAPTVAKGSYRVVVGSIRKGKQIDETELPMVFPEDKSIHIFPTISGAKNGGVGKLIIGVALLGVAAIATSGFSLVAGGSAFGLGAGTWGSIAMVGASMALTGIATLLSPVPKSPDMRQNERPEDRPSFMLGGAVNVVEQGHPIPICGGENILGGIVISAGVSIERLPV